MYLHEISPVTYIDHCIFQNEVVQLREELEVWKEHGPKQDRVRLPSFNEDSFVDSTSQDEVQYLKAIVSKLQQEKQQWSKNVNEQYLGVGGSGSQFLRYAVV